jgi:hypothetical protein
MSMCTSERLKSTKDIEWSLLPSFTSNTKRHLANTSVVASSALISAAPMYPFLTRE